MDPSSIDLPASLSLFGVLSLVLGMHLVASILHGRPLIAARVEREAGLPIVGRAPMHAVYRALDPIARALIFAGIGANAITVASGFLGLGAAVAFAFGHFGIGAAIASIAALADGLDGLVARLTHTNSRYGQVLDTMIDRFVDAMLLGGIALFVRTNVALLVLTLAAIVGSFMVSYASSVERELRVDAAPAPMRRSHRLVFVVLAAALSPITAATLGPDAALPTMFIAVTAIAIVGNVSAVRRLLRAGELSAAPVVATPSPTSDPPPEAVHARASGGE